MACAAPGCGPTGPAGLVTPSSFFQAQLSQINGLVSVATTSRPIFFNVVTAGGLDAAYDTTTGIFTAPRAGFYSFAVNVVASNTNVVVNTLAVSLVVNGTATNSQTAQVPATVGQVAAVAFASLLLLSAADEVQVTCLSGATSSLNLGSNVYPVAAMSTFTCTSLF
jgi:hypothetical protein